LTVERGPSRSAPLPVHWRSLAGRTGSRDNVLLTQSPTLPEIRAAAARGNSRAIVDLPMAEERDERLTRM
jgi:hypothetical protein